LGCFSSSFKTLDENPVPYDSNWILKTVQKAIRNNVSLEINCCTLVNQPAENGLANIWVMLINISGAILGTM